MFEIRGETAVINRELDDVRQQTSTTKLRLARLQGDLNDARGQYAATQDQSETNLDEGTLRETKQRLTEEMRRLQEHPEFRKAMSYALNRQEIIATALRARGALIVCRDLDEAAEVANFIAPEHLELHIRDPFEVMGQIRNAGAVFVGDYTPEPVGDYMAGPNHVLPTAGTARFASALSVDNFIKKTSVIQYTQKAFRREADDIMRLAEIEGLTAHARSVKIRL